MIHESAQQHIAQIIRTGGRVLRVTMGRKNSICQSRPFLHIRRAMEMQRGKNADCDGRTPKKS